MRIFIQSILLICLVASLTQCKKAGDRSTHSTEKVSADVLQFEYVEGEGAKTAINTDNLESFFDRIANLEMSIIMKDPEIQEQSRDIILNAFKKAQSEDIDVFSASDKEIIDSVISRVNGLLQNLNQKFEIPDISLIKLKGNLYGPSVYFTRENAIFIPTDEIFEENFEGLTEVFLHEIWHIISRYNSEAKTNMYSLIGFKPLSKPLEIGEDLRKRLLHNPDGLDFGYGIELTNEEDNPILAVPMIKTNAAKYSLDKPAYFSYLQFELYRVEEGEKSSVLQFTPELEPEIPDLYYQSFFDQIKDNTQYIIHPDEIMADNFMFAILDNEGIQELDFSPEGKKLIEEVQTIIFNETK